MRQIAASLPPPKGSLTKDSALDHGRETRCLKAVRVMYAFWRKSDAFDPEMFAAGAAAVLAEYPSWVVDLVTDPRTGLPSQLDFPPTIKEVKDACETLVEMRRRREERQTSLRAQFAQREEYLRSLEERKKAPTREELERKLGRSIAVPQAPTLRPKELWEGWCLRRYELPGVKLAPEARSILEEAGYDVDGPDDQNPVKEVA